MTSPVRVLLVDDDPLVRSGLTMMLDGVDGIELVGDAADGDDAVEMVAEHGADVVLMDVRMPRVNGIAATERLRARTDPPEVIVLTTFDTDDNILRALHAGASGFLVKDTRPMKIVEAIRQVADGEPILSPSVARRLMDRAAASTERHQRAQTALATLSEREREVVIAIGRGHGNAEIAAELHMSLATVKAHVSHILTKLDLNNRTQIALLAYDSELA